VVISESYERDRRNIYLALSLIWLFKDYVKTNIFDILIMEIFIKVYYYQKRINISKKKIYIYTSKNKYDKIKIYNKE